MYNKTHPSGIFVFLEYLMRTFRSLVFVVVIVCCREYSETVGELVLIGYSLTYLLIQVINFRKYVNKLYWALGILKSFGLIGFQLGYLFIGTAEAEGVRVEEGSSGGSGTDGVCFYMIICLIGF